MITALVILVAVSIVVSSLTVCLPGCAFALGQFRARRRQFTDWTLTQPPVPDTDDEYLTIPPLVFPADVTMEELEEYAAAIEKAAIRAEFAAIMRPEFPQYRCFRARQ